MSLCRLFIGAFCLSAIFVICNSANSESAGKKVAHDYEIITPKPGYIGGPLTPAAIPNMRPPMDQRHFNKRYIRVTEIAERELSGLQRVVLRLDEIDNKGSVFNRGLYFVYINISPEGAAIIQKNEDDNSSENDLGSIKNRIPFPFTCARSPGLGFKNGDTDGFAIYNRRGPAFVRKTAKGTKGPIQVEAVYFEKQKDANDTKPDTRWYGTNIAEVTNSGTTRTLFREKQEWANEADWLWTKMERYDANGNIMMRCKEIKIGKDGVEYFTTDTAATNAAQTNEIMSTTQPSINELTGTNR